MSANGPATPLHLALGEEASPFSLDLLDRAIELAVEETADLDWKRELPRKEVHDEFAKDVAAMANSGGGMIVYGVAEVPGPSSAAGSITGVAGWGDAEERRLRQVAYSNIQPPVHGLTFQVAERNGVRVIAMRVPGSPDAPHLVWSKDRFLAPIRYGAQTEFMRERDIERAYRARWNARTTQEELVTQRAQQVIESVARSGQVWFTAVAAPKQPRPPHLGRVERQTATQVFQRLIQASPHLVQRSGAIVNINPRPGLRRWRTTGRSRGVEDAVVAEIYDDGGMAFAVAGHPPREVTRPTHVHLMVVQQFVANSMWLARLVAETLHVDSAFDLMITVTCTDPEPIYFRAFDYHGFMLDEEELAPIRRFIPVRATFEPLADANESLLALRDVATDVVNQGGLEHLGSTYIKAPGGVD